MEGSGSEEREEGWRRRGWVQRDEKGLIGARVRRCRAGNQVAVISVGVLAGVTSGSSADPKRN